MIDRFATLLQELGIEYGIPLHPDKLGMCKLCVNDNFHVQLECSPSQEHLLIVTFLGELPIGAFRESVFKTALKVNYAHPGRARLSYCERNHQLALYHSLLLASLQGKGLADQLKSFLEQAGQWVNAIQEGNVSALYTPAEKKPQSPRMFGMNP